MPRPQAEDYYLAGLVIGLAWDKLIAYKVREK